MAAKKVWDCVLVRAVDGDTFILAFDLGFDITITKRFRVNGINAPEINSKDPEEKKIAEAAKAFAKSFEGTKATVSLTGQDNYGRLLGSLNIAGADYAELILSKGLATKMSLMAAIDLLDESLYT